MGDRPASRPAGQQGGLEMGLFDVFRRPPRIASLDDFDEFADSHAAFLVQKCIFEYARARSGTLSGALFKEKAFVDALDESRWRNYQICLGHVLQMVDAVMRPRAIDRVAALTEGLVDASARITARYDVPAGMAPDFWARARRYIEGRLRRASLAAPHPVKDIAKNDFQTFFDQLPIHERLRGHDFTLVRNNLRINLCRAHEIFLARIDETVLVTLLTTDPAPTPSPVDRVIG
jgi:hypothetical protein